MTLETQASLRIPRPRAEVYAFAVRCDTFPRILRPYGPIPGVARTAMVDGTTSAGAVRRVTLTDGATMEELVTFDPPNRHRYRWRKPPAGPLAWLVRGAEAEWTFRDAPDGTDVVWTYRFELASVLAYPLAAGVVALFRRWMRRGLAAARTALCGG